MFIELEDFAVIKAQAFPHRVAALHGRIERAYAGLIAMHELAADVDDEVAILGVELLEHDFTCWCPIAIAARTASHKSLPLLSARWSDGWAPYHVVADSARTSSISRRHRTKTS